ncbi:hypothetical protein OUZ56_000704 [Daphnia magna]|uniref:Uncharacterized protein n=1 Tax=Daphnia magna TaxID=35525 RepID=A0ABR0A153_9CRUS|nr:hypothetical protein OUZ56_000704 [Daphnia magna]
MLSITSVSSLSMWYWMEPTKVLEKLQQNRKQNIKKKEKCRSSSSVYHLTWSILPRRLMDSRNNTVEPCSAALSHMYLISPRFWRKKKGKIKRVVAANKTELLAVLGLRISLLPVSLVSESLFLIGARYTSRKDWGGNHYF